MDRARRLCRRLLHRLYRPYVLWRVARPGRTRLFGRSLLTDPAVFHPVYFLSTRILGEYLATQPLQGRRLLDMGTGSGAIAVLAAEHGAAVTACDVNPRAVALARQNADRAGVGARVEVVCSDLFTSLDGRRFDLIVFNVPFYPRAPRTPLEAAFFAGPDFATVRRFAADAPGFLEDAGAVVVIFSEDSGHRRILAMFEDAGLTAVEQQTRHRLFERFHVLRLQRSVPPPPGTDRRF